MPDLNPSDVLLYEGADTDQLVTPLVEELPRFLQPHENVLLMAGAGWKTPLHQGLLAVTDERIVFLQALQLHEPRALAVDVPLADIGGSRIPDSFQSYGILILYTRQGRFRFTTLQSPQTAETIAGALNAASPAARLPIFVRVLRLRDAIRSFLWRWIWA